MMGEFSGHLDANVGDGDVKYHMGFSQDITIKSGRSVHISMMPNPSHLEAVNSVLMGVCRSKQILKGDQQKNRTLAVLLHGDASFSGQGSVYETLNMSDLKGYSIGGAIHIIVNNQIGFTTSPQEARSTPNCTDVATMLEFPIFHVNADEADHALRVTNLALEFRYKFHRDVIIDVVGYRRYGHNEGDEPSFTQPIMYQKIKNQTRVRKIYQEKLIQEKLLDQARVKELVDGYNRRLEDHLLEAKTTKISPMMDLFGDKWKGMNRPTNITAFQEVDTSVTPEIIQKVGAGLLTVPDTFNMHPKIKKLLQARQEMLEGKKGVDWSFGEALAIGTLLLEGTQVRLAGQDSERGTFSQRHAVWHDVQSGEKFNPFNHLDSQWARFEVVNSLLSEYAALGFEYGSSMANPAKLSMWEAQFGDFINGAQVIIDQFLISAAAKWNRYSGLVLLLPHGYEGQGPEHSSARIEVFLKACAQNNIQVCNPTTPAQYFHLLRRQMKRNFRIPLVVMTPKSFLRNPEAVSNLRDFQTGTFSEIIDDHMVTNKKQIKRLVYCSGKVYYDLLAEQERQMRDHVAIIRMEQFYPFPIKKHQALVDSYPNAKEIIWCQEGPKNMEGWGFVMQRILSVLLNEQKLFYAGRASQASPADSYLHIHLQEMDRIVKAALDGPAEPMHKVFKREDSETSS